MYHPLKKGEPIEEGTIFKAADYEETYFVDKADGKYAISQHENHFTMLKDSSVEIVKGYGRYRKLTPRECLRLMGFDDTFKIVVSDTATYKQAGNSIIVNVLMALLKKIDITQYGID